MNFDVYNYGLSYSGVGAKPKIPDGIPPRFPKKPTIRQEGDNLVMECLLEAHPMPEITWYRRDKVSVPQTWVKVDVFDQMDLL